MAKTGEVCIANIGPMERRRRLNFGIIGLTAGALFAIALWLVDAPVWMRTVVFLPFASGAFGFWQYREKT